MLVRFVEASFYPFPLHPCMRPRQFLAQRCAYAHNPLLLCRIVRRGLVIGEERRERRLQLGGRFLAAAVCLLGMDGQLSAALLETYQLHERLWEVQTPLGRQTRSSGYFNVSSG